MTDIGFALNSFSRLYRRRAVGFLISDFLDRGFEKQLKAVGKRHDLIAVSLDDPREYQLPGVGMVELEDSETGKRFLLDTGSKEVRDVYRADLCSQAAFCLSVGIHCKKSLGNSPPRT